MLGVLDLDPDVFEVRGFGEIGGHAAVAEGDGAGERGAELGFEFAVAELVAIGATEHPTTLL